MKDVLIELSFKVQRTFEAELRSRPAGGCDAPSQKGAGDALVAGWHGVFSGV
jgi:hypothetical protein